jgi:hypothetical protein
MKCAVAVLVVVITFAGVAAAQPAAASAKLPSDPVAQPASQDRVSERTAFWLSFGGAVASWTTLGAGISMGHGYLVGAGMVSTLFAPTIGHWYAHRTATRGLGLRAGGAAAILVGVALVPVCEETCGDGYSAALALLLFGGSALYIAGTIDDVATAHRTARSYNARDHLIAPIVNPSTGSIGLAFTGRF